MINAVAECVVFVFGLLMFFVDFKYRVAMLLFVGICFSMVDLTFLPVMHNSGSWVTYTFLISILPSIMNYIKELRHTVIYWCVIMMFVGSVICVINSPHYNTSFLVALKFLISDVGTYCLVLPLAFLCVKFDDDLVPMVKAAFGGMLILTGIGVINYIMKSSFWLEAMPELDAEVSTRYMYDERFRVQAMFQNPFNYGFINMVMAYFFYYVKKKGLLGAKGFWIMELCCLFGVITCMCRTVHVCYLIGIVVYMLAAYDFKRTIMYGLVALLLALLIVPQTPAFKEYSALFDKALNTDIRVAEGGSSLALRMLQFNTVLYYIQDSFWVGRGSGFFGVDLGWENMVNNTGKAYDSDLAGLEGAYLSKLLERGVIGLAFYIIFYMSLFIAGWCMRKCDKQTFGLFASVIAVYFAFAQMTGELSSPYPTLLLLGVTLKLLYVKSGKLYQFTLLDDKTLVMSLKE